MTGKELKGETYIILLNDNKPRELIIDFNAYAEIEEKMGGLAGLHQLLNRDSSKPILKKLRLMIWAGIAHLKEGLSEIEVGRLIPLDEKRLMAISNSIIKAASRDFPTATASEKKSTKKQKT